MIKVSKKLSINKTKRKLFSVDPYFRDCWDDLCEIWPHEDEILDNLCKIGLVIFRPDAIVSRNLNLALEQFLNAGMKPIAVTTFSYDRMKVREGWRYQLNIATRDRIDVMDMILIGQPSILILYADEKEDNLPASVQLSLMKGPSLPESRKEHHLRFILGGAQVSVLTYVHISDEPADVIRELGVFLSSDERKLFFKKILNPTNVTKSVFSVIEDLYDEYPESSILLSDAFESLRYELSQISDFKDPLIKEINDQLEAVENCSDKNWRLLLDRCENLGIKLDRWRKIAIAAELSSRHFDDLHPIIPDIGLSEWMKFRAPI